VNAYGHSAVTCGDLRASLAFYRDALGLPVLDERSTQDRSTVTLGLPGTTATWLLEQHHGIERHPASSRPCDPGFAHLCLYTGDARGLFDRLHRDGFRSCGPVVTVSAGPHAGAKAVYTLDPDGFAVELYQRAGENGPSEVTGFFHHGLTVRDMEATLAFWLGALGAGLESRGARAGAAVAPVVGVEPESMEAVFVSLPRDRTPIELFEYRGIERHPATARDEDPASSRLALRVADPEALRERIGGDHDRHGTPRVPTPDGYPVLLLPA
jgi:lactoylglutathione lyase